MMISVPYVGGFSAPIVCRKMSLQKKLYTTVLRRPSTYVATIFATAFLLEIGFDTGFTSIYDKMNQGVNIPN